MKTPEPMPDFLRLDQYRLPSHLYSGICPHVDQVREEYRLWCGQMTHLSPQGRERYRQQNLSYAASRCYPHPFSYRRALACALQLFWMTLFDDYHGLSSSDEFADKREQVIDLLRGGRPSGSEKSLLGKIAEFRDLSLTLMPQRWLDRYIVNIDEYFRKGVEREAAFKGERRIPTVSELLQFRPYTIAMYPYFRMVEVELGLELPDEVVTHPHLVHIEYLLARIEIWQNDAFSLLKEMSRSNSAGEVINLALVLQNETGLSLEESCSEMLRIHNADVEEFSAMVASLPDFGPLNRDVESYLFHLALTVSGLETWYRTDSARYSINGTWTDEYAHGSTHSGNADGERQR